MTTENLQENCYKEAVAICKDTAQFSKIQNARNIFADLGDYKDSAEYLKRCDDFLAYQPGNKVIFGEYNGQPLSWTVLKTEGYRCMLFADDVLEYRYFHEFRRGVAWNDCDLRKWLNRDFLDTAFSFQEKLKIQIQKLDNDFDPRWAGHNGPDTKDKIYVFSDVEMLEFMPTEEDRAINKWWWLRGHGGSDLSQKAICPDGVIYYNGIDVCNTDVAVRPVMWIKISF